MAMRYIDLLFILPYFLTVFLTVASAVQNKLFFSIGPSFSMKVKPPLIPFSFLSHNLDVDPVASLSAEC